MKTDALSFAAAMLLAPPAWAHGLDANRVEVVLHEEVVEAVATPPAEFFRGADQNGDGRLDVPEVRARQAEILRTIREALSITDHSGRAGTLEREDISVPIGDGPGPRDYLRYTVKLRWTRAPRSLLLRCGFVGEHPVTVFATRADSRSARGSLTLVGEGEFSTLASPRDLRALLGAPPTSPPPTPAAAQPSPQNGVHALGAAALIVALVGAVVLARRR